MFTIVAPTRSAKVLLKSPVPTTLAELN